MNNFLGDGEMGLFVVLGIGIVALLIIVFTFVTRYQTASPDEAMIVSGSLLGSRNVHVDAQGNKVKIVRGGGAFIFPVLQQSRKLSLLSSKLDISTEEGIYTEEGVPVFADGVAIVKIGGSLEDISTASEQYLGKPRVDMENECKTVLSGHLRAILGEMTIEQINKDRKTFSQRVQEVASTDLEKMGLQIVSFTIKGVRDEEGYLDSLGKKRIAEVKRDAEIAQAEASKETRIKQAEAHETARRFEIEKETLIAESEKEQTLKKAAYKREEDEAKAKADNAYKLEDAKLQKEIKEKEMDVQITERTKQIELEGKETERRKNQYNAEVREKAEADAFAVKQNATAEQFKKEADAKAEAEKVRLAGQADSESIRLIGLAEAEASAAKVRLSGQAEAESIRLKGLAEAEAKEKLAEAYEKYGQAAIAEMLINVLPEMIKESAASLSNIDKITVVDTGGGKGGGASKVAGYATDLITTAQEQLSATTGLDLKSLIEDVAGKKNLKPSLEDIANKLDKETE